MGRMKRGQHPQVEARQVRRGLTSVYNHAPVHSTTKTVVTSDDDGLSTISKRGNLDQVISQDTPQPTLFSEDSANMLTQQSIPDVVSSSGLPSDSSPMCKSPKAQSPQPGLHRAGVSSEMVDDAWQGTQNDTRPLWMDIGQDSPSPVTSSVGPDTSPSVFLHQSISTMRPPPSHLLPSATLPALPLNEATIGTLLPPSAPPKKRVGSHRSSRTDSFRNSFYYSRLIHPTGNVESSRLLVNSVNPYTSSDSSIKSEALQQRHKRFLRTREALENSGLLKVTMKTADLMKMNKVLSHDIQDLKRNTQEFLLSVLQNPENKKFHDFILSQSLEKYMDV